MPQEPPVHGRLFCWNFRLLHFVMRFSSFSAPRLLSRAVLATLTGALAVSAHAQVPVLRDTRVLRPAPEEVRAARSPALALSAYEVAFEDTPAGGLSSIRTLIVSNTADTPVQELSIELDAVPGAFKLFSSCAGALAARSSCSVMLRFSPASAGRYLGRLLLTEPGASASVALSGFAPEDFAPFQAPR